MFMNNMPFKNSLSRLNVREQAGFTLLEILVAIVVLSIGLLGLAGLQAASLNNNQTAYYRSVASQQAYDMADRMRANLAGIAAENYNNLTTNWKEDLPTNPNCVATECSAEEMAATDYFQWYTNNNSLLPDGDGIVRCVSGPAGCVNTVANSNRAFDIIVTWLEKGDAFVDANCPVGAPENTRCFVTRFTP